MNWIVTIFLVIVCLSGGVIASSVTHGLGNNNATEPYKSYQNGDLGMTFLVASVPAFLLGHHILGYLCLVVGVMNFVTCWIGLWQYARKNHGRE